MYGLIVPGHAIPQVILCILLCGIVQKLFPVTCRRAEWTVEGNGIHRAASVQVLTVEQL